MFRVDVGDKAKMVLDADAEGKGKLIAQINVRDRDIWLDFPIAVSNVVNIDNYRERPVKFEFPEIILPPVINENGSLDLVAYVFEITNEGWKMVTAKDFDNFAEYNKKVVTHYPPDVRVGKGLTKDEYGSWIPAHQTTTFGKYDKITVTFVLNIVPNPNEYVNFECGVFSTEGLPEIGRTRCNAGGEYPIGYFIFSPPKEGWKENSYIYFLANTNPLSYKRIQLNIE